MSQVIIRNPNETITGVPRQVQESQSKVEEKLPQQMQSTIQDTVSQTQPKQLIKPTKVVIGMPMTKEIEFRWFVNFLQLLRQSPHGINTDIIVGAQYGVAESRQKIVDTFMGMPDATHLLWLDTDMFPVDFAIPTLLNDNLPVVSGVYFNSLYTGLACWKDEVPLDFQTMINTSRETPLIEVDKIGMGLCMMKKEVFQTLTSIDRPWFYYKGTDGGASEDFYFCSLLRRIGIKPVIDLRVQAQHMKMCMIAPNKAISL